MSDKSDNQPLPETLFKQLLALQSADEAALPPVEKWHPELSGDMDMRIARDGTWYHEGDPIKRESLVKLFSSILIREGDDYYLKTPVEKWRIQVEDAPFVVVGVSVENPGSHQALAFTTNVGSTVVLNPENPLWVHVAAASGEPAPYIRVRNNLNGLINRNVYYELAELAVEQELQGASRFGVWSMGGFYPLD